MSLAQCRVSALHLGRLRVMAILCLDQLAHADHRRAGERDIGTDGLSVDVFTREDA